VEKEEPKKDDSPSEYYKPKIVKRPAAVEKPKDIRETGLDEADALDTKGE
jgi:hypothetical protein